MEFRKPNQKSQRSDINAWNRLMRKWLVEEISFKLEVKLRCGKIKKYRSRTKLTSVRDGMASWRNSLGGAFQRTRCDSAVVSSTDFQSGGYRFDPGSTVHAGAHQASLLSFQGRQIGIRSEVWYIPNCGQLSLSNHRNIYAIWPSVLQRKPCGNITVCLFTSLMKWL